MQIFRATQLVFVLTLCLIPASAEKKPKPPLEKTYETSVDKAYVAMVRAAGSNLVSEVKEACLVNFKFGQNLEMDTTSWSMLPRHAEMLATDRSQSLSPLKCNTTRSE